MYKYCIIVYYKITKVSYFKEFIDYLPNCDAQRKKKKKKKKKSWWGWGGGGGVMPYTG